MPVSHTDTCLFCSLAAHQTDAAIAFEDQQVMAAMDLYPANTGHTLVFPKEHVEDVYSMPGDLAGRVMAVAVEVSKSIKRTLAPDGLNLIQANGPAAGQTNRHFHIHVLPRYNGDRVSLRFGRTALPESMDQLRGTASAIRSGLRGKD